MTPDELTARYQPALNAPKEDLLELERQNALRQLDDARQQLVGSIDEARRRLESKK